MRWFQYDINIRVEYMSFSAHADAKGIMQLIRDVEPRNVMFVHGEDIKMNFLKEKVEKVTYGTRIQFVNAFQEFNLPVFKPANGETITIECNADVELEIPEEIIAKSIANDPTPSKRFCPFSACVLMDKQVCI